MLASDLWSLVIQHVDCTQSLLRLRQVNKAFRSEIPTDLITGIPSDTLRLFCHPRVMKYGKIDVSDNEDIEGVIVDDGKEFWAWVYTDPVRLTQYSISEDDGVRSVTRRVTKFKTNFSNETFLWVKITSNGLFCLLTVSNDDQDTSPAIFSVLRRIPGQELLETVMTAYITRKHILRQSFLVDEPVENTFARRSLQCFAWGDRSFLIMLPLHKRDQIWCMEIQRVVDATWTCHTIASSLRIGCVRQIKNLLYIFPERAGRVYSMDFNETDPSPVFRHTIPELPTGVSWFGTNASIRKVYIATSANVSDDGENYIIQDQGAKKVFHLTKTTIRLLHVDSQRFIHDVCFMGNNAVICSFRNKSQFSLYNLRTKDFVKTFNFKFDSFLSLFGKDCIWSVGPTMTVYRQIADQ
jgi:hypothetical protein